jgi:hypothetical protein
VILGAGVCETTDRHIEQISNNAGKTDLKFFNGFPFERESRFEPRHFSRDLMDKKNVRGRGALIDSRTSLWQRLFASYFPVT